eukprot:4655443-Pleurochrysis_carterae.AAC.2
MAANPPATVEARLARRPKMASVKRYRSESTGGATSRDQLTIVAEATPERRARKAAEPLGGGCSPPTRARRRVRGLSCGKRSRMNKTNKMPRRTIREQYRNPRCADRILDAQII